MSLCAAGHSRVALCVCSGESALVAVEVVNITTIRNFLYRCVRRSSTQLRMQVRISRCSARTTG